MVRFPDPEQYYNNWKNDVIVSCDQVEETFRSAPTLLGSYTTVSLGPSTIVCAIKELY